MVQLYVGGLSGAATESQLARLFAPYGPVVSIRILRDWFTGRPLGFGFVEISAAAADSAIAALNGFPMEGRRLMVQRQESRIGGRSPERATSIPAAT